MMSESMYRYLSFRVGGQRYGIQLDDVVELMPMLMLTELPGAMPGVVGLMTRWDGVMPVIDLRIRLGVSQPEYRLDTPIITVRTEQGQVGFMVDDADRVESVSGVDAIACQGSESAYVKGAARLQDGLLLVLDINKLTVGIQDALV